MESGTELSMKEIKAIRKARGTASRIARECGVHPSTVSKVLSGQRTGAYDKVTARVIQALKAEARRLLAGR